jgi:ATP-GRASP peptide maturase of grasp-with-spasm system
MILILSQATAEFSTELVLDWLSALQANFFFLTGDELLDTTQMHVILNKDVQSLTIVDKKKKLSNKEVGVVWFRRKVSENFLKFYEDLNAEPEVKDVLVNYLRKEYQLFYSTLSLVLDDVPWLNAPETSTPNKLQVLITAKKCGLEIPSTLLTNYPSTCAPDVAEKLITKPLTDFVRIKETPGTSYDMLTSLVHREEISRQQTLVFPSQIQEHVEKAFEIRTFYLGGRCKSIAIFSQLDEQTKIDFRNYNAHKPTRSVPYNLPRDIEKKLKRLMTLLALESGSIDLIKAKDGRFVFLEVNPVGQFDWVSFYGNYNIEKDIADYLFKKNKYAKEKNKRMDPS